MLSECLLLLEGSCGCPMPLRGGQAIFGAPFLVPSESPQFRPQNSLMGFITAQPDSSPSDGKMSGVLVAGCGQGWIPIGLGGGIGEDAGGSGVEEEKVGEEGEVDQEGEDKGRGDFGQSQQGSLQI